jgi:biotin carboxyl carrier protein
MYKATVNAKTDLQIRMEGDSVLVNESKVNVNKVKLSETRSHWILNEKSMNVELVEANLQTKEFIVKVNNRSYALKIADQYDQLLKSLGMEVVSEKKVKEIKAPMPGMVLNILVKEGDSVEKDTPILILEAMKMENVIKSSTGAVVKKVHAIKGVAVEKNAILVEFES